MSTTDHIYDHPFWPGARAVPAVRAVPPPDNRRPPAEGPERALTGPGAAGTAGGSYWPPPAVRGAPSGFPPLQRAQIVALACLEPVARGLHITHWSGADLARQAVLDGIVPAVSPRTVRRILDAVDRQPHRTRFWRTARLDARFKERAEKVLWCSANAERLARQDIWVVCTDEMPNKQVLERRPIRRAIPGSIERREFEYTRHGTVNLLTFLVVHTGLKRGSWASREEYITHVEGSWPEYDRLYAHPFEWTWTNQKMRRWFAEHAP